MPEMKKPCCFNIKAFPFIEEGFEQLGNGGLKTLQKPRCPVTGEVFGHLQTFVPEPLGYDEIERWKDEVGLYNYI